MKKLLLPISFLLIIQLTFAQKFNVLDYGAKPNEKILSTEAINKTIEACAESGGGTVYFPIGQYLTGTINLKSNVTIEFEKGTIIEGSDKIEDYSHKHAFFWGEDLENIKIIGEATIDGVDCYNPKGEEGFRGPHCIHLVNCHGIELRGYTITRSGNWAHRLRHCSDCLAENLTVRGGHDAFHPRWCKNFTVRNCDFRTGDDCFAGNDNIDFLIEDIKANTSCNAFRFGCQNLVVRNVHIWGPGEFIHKIQKRNNTLSAFVHFSPEGEKPTNKSGNWLVQNVTIEGVDNAFNYNFKDGLWQTGQPATDMVFENIRIKNVKKAFNIVGDTDRQFKLTIRNAKIGESDDTNFTEMRFEGRDINVPAFFNIENFDVLKLENVQFSSNGNAPSLSAQNGNKLVLIKTKEKNDAQREPFVYSNIEEVKIGE